MKVYIEKRLEGKAIECQQWLFTFSLSLFCTFQCSTEASITFQWENNDLQKRIFFGIILAYIDCNNIY